LRRAVYLGESAPKNTSWPGGWVERQIRHLARSAWCEAVPASTPDLLRGCNIKLHTNAPGAAPSHPGLISRRAVYLGESAALRHCVLRDKLADYNLAAVSLTPLQAGLEHCLKTWQEMPVQGPRAAARSESHMGGQGVVRCTCNGVCSRRCKCKREGRVCTAACRCDPNLCQKCESSTHTRLVLTLGRNLS